MYVCNFVCVFVQASLRSTVNLTSCTSTSQFSRSSFRLWKTPDPPCRAPRATCWSTSGPSIHRPRYIHTLIDNRFLVLCVYVCSENLQPETLRPYLPMLLTRLATLLQSPQKTTKVSLPVLSLVLPLVLPPYPSVTVEIAAGFYLE